MTVAAIDLGSSAVRVAIARDGEARVLAAPDGSDEIPAVVSFASAAPQVGRPALGAAVTSPATTVRGVKRWLGAERDETALAALRAEAGLPAHVGARGIEFSLHQARTSAVSVAALLTRHALARVAQDVGAEPTAVVFTSPLPDPRDCEAALMLVAAELGVATVSSVPEPVAAAAGACTNSSERAVWIADVGAGHVSIAAVQLRPGSEPEALYAIGEPIGGDDVDRAIAARLIGTRAGVLDAGLREMVRQECERTKIDLASTPSMRCATPPHLASILGLAPNWTLDLTGLTEAASPLLHAIESCCERARGAVRLDPDTELYVIGGMTRLPIVRARIEQAFGTRARAVRAPGVVALGAARLALAAPPTRSPARMQARVSWRAPRLATPAPPGFGSPETPSPGASPPAPAGPTGSAPATGDSRRTPTASVATELTPTPEARPSSNPPLTGSSTPPRERPASADLTDAVRAVRPPLTRPASASVLGLNEGRIRNPSTPAELLTVPLARPIRQSDLDPIALPLLLLLTSNARRSGTLTLRMEGSSPLQIAFVSGRALLSASEARALTEVFPSFAGTFTFTVGEPETTGRRLEQRMAPIVFEGLRRMTRAFDPDAIVAALGDRFERAPVLRPTQQQAAARLGLTDVERRLVNFAFNGRSAASSVVEHGGAQHTALGLLLLLSLYDLVEWRAPSMTTQPSLRVQMEERARRIEQANYFQALGVHWSALEDEIHAAHAKIREELSPGQPVFEIAPDACRRMLALADEAYACLSDARRRGAYRRQAYPDVDFEAAEDLVDRKRRAVSLRDDGKQEVQRLDRTQKEISRSKGKPKTLG
jgi:hypothetical protein